MNLHRERGEQGMDRCREERRHCYAVQIWVYFIHTRVSIMPQPHDWGLDSKSTAESSYCGFCVDWRFEAICMITACMCVLCYWQEVERFWHHWRNVHKLLLFFLLYMIFSVWAHSVPPPPPPPPPYAHLLLSSVFELCLVLIQELHIWTPSSNDPQWGSQCLRQHSEGSLVCYFWLWFINPLA